MSQLEVTLHAWPLDGDAHTARARAMSVLSDGENARIDALATATLRLRSRLARLGLRRILAHFLQCRPRDVPLTTRLHGKPAIDEQGTALAFNLSHTSSIALLAVSWDTDVGVDLEHRDERLTADEAAVFLSQTEADTPALERIPLWVRKEASAKCIGVGLTVDPRSIRLLTRSTTNSCPVVWDVIEPAMWRGLRVDDVQVGREHVAAVATRANGHDVCIRPVQWSTVHHLLHDEALDDIDAYSTSARHADVWPPTTEAAL